MSSKILIKRSTTTGAIPTTADLDTGEFAVNTVDKRIFTNNQGTIVELGTTPSTQAVAGNATVGGTFAVTGATTLSTGSTTGNFSVAGTLQLDTEGTASNHVVTKAYVDTAISDLVDGAGSALDTLKELADAINNDANFATTITNSIATKLSKSGDTMTGNLNMGSNKVTSSTNPTADDDLTRKGYVDTILGSATAAATSASEAATSATNAATSESNASASATSASSSASSASSSATSASASATSASTSASSASTSASQASTSASNAATSATNAENAFDSFDDRYLGAKATDPTLDNDGEALLTGAMYFDSSNNVMKVYNGSEWQNASSSIEGIKSDFVYTATASQTVFSGSDDNAETLVIDKAGLVNVYLNGVRLVANDVTITPATNTVTLATGASAGDIVEIEVFGNFAGQSGADVAITGGSISGVDLTATSFTSTGIDDNATSTAITIDASENVGIGTVSPNSNGGANATVLHINDSTTGNWAITHYTNGTTGANADDGLIVGNIGADAYIYNYENSNLIFGTNTSERARIDASGNLLVGKTAANNNNVGVEAKSNGNFSAVTDGITPALFRRKTNDGTIVEFAKDSATVGSIGSVSSGVAGVSFTNPTYGGIRTADYRINPVNGSGANFDNSIDLGAGGNRFKDLYLSGGVYLGGTGSANKLDDYEEGTYVATVTCTGSGSITANTGSDRLAYTKVGRKVTVTGIFTALSVSSPTGALQVTLPFASANLEDLSEFSRTMSYAYCSGTGTPSGAGYYPATYSGAGASSVLTVYFWQQNGGMDTSSADWFGAGSELYFMYTYFTT